MVTTRRVKAQSIPAIACAPQLEGSYALSRKPSSSGGRSFHRDFPDGHAPKRLGADGRPQKGVDLPTARQQTGAECAWAGSAARVEHGILALFCHRCRTAPSRTPVPSSSISPEGRG